MTFLYGCLLLPTNIRAQVMKASLPITRCLVGSNAGESDADLEGATTLALHQLLELVQVGE